MEAIGDPLVVARLQEQLGRTYLGLGLLPKAEVLFRKALATRQAKLGSDHPLTLSSMFNHAAAIENSSEAIEPLKRVWTTQSKVLGPDHLDTLRTLDELGEAYGWAGKPAEAVNALEQVRDGLARQIPEDDPRALINLARLAGAYLGVGKTTQALALYEKVIDVEKKVYGDSHPLVIMSMINAANAYQMSYKMRQALALYEKARDAALAKLGPEHPHTLTALDRLATMYRAFNRTAEAIAMAERAREGRQRILGPDHPDTLKTLETLALAYEAAGQLDKALPLYQQAAAGAEKLAFAIPDAWTVVRNLCDCYERLGQYDQAEVWWRKWLNRVKEREGPSSTAYCRDLEGLGSNLLKQNKHAAAERIFRECLGLLREKHPEETHAAYYAQSQLGAALLGQEKYAEAEPLLLGAYQAMYSAEKQTGHRFPGASTTDRVTEALERLVHLYDARKTPDEAAKWRKELEVRLKATTIVKPPNK